MIWPFSPTRFELPNCPDESETLYLLQYSTWGHHSLAYYRKSHLIEYTYGDWELFALNKRNTYTSIKNMLLPTMGALGRKSVPWEPGQPICPLFVDCVDVVPFPAPADLAQSLFEELETAYLREQSEELLNEDEGVHFVPYYEPYSVAYNCNHALAKWLEQLGGKISGRVFYHPDFIAGMTPRIASIP